ncbi:MAG: glutamine--fructose-6-phosphate transaminase (isomerizing) [Oscillospiraceae bacterium]|jgi:glucosamine--fructose-6-phosphate aminotransferase (isomerizing)|nr:glutamine--fructose-6-phosphate transaminase (isomerizing) [Oscillospiraceae bacterium]
MCGIIGYAGKNEAAPIMLDSLRRLEYRGYDSAGLVVSRDKKLYLTKSAGYVQILADLTEEGAQMPGHVGLGHTRWATHGQPNDANAHPHISDGGTIAVVHNGIIENYRKLREFLTGKGFTFSSETDTEVAVNLIQYYYDRSHDILRAVADAARRMEGSYALGILCEDLPDTLIATKRESPLSIGAGDGENYITSDVAAIITRTRNIITLRDYEIAVLRADGVELYSGELDRLTRKAEVVDWDVAAAEKGGYPHFMLKEIMEQPESVRRSLSPRIRDGEIILDELEIPDDYLKSISKIYIAACGTADFAGVVMKYNLERIARVPTEVVFASEFRYNLPPIDETTLVICISQSGTTADTIAAMREAKKNGARVLSIVNVVGSVIAEESDWSLLTLAGPEISVASTKAYSTQLAVGYLVTLYFAKVRGTVTPDAYKTAVDALVRLPDAIEETLKLQETTQYLASRYFSSNDIYFIGRGLDYALSLEGDQKLKEISYIHSEAYAAGELKHGPIALIDAAVKTPVVAVATNKRLIDKMVSNAVEVKSRGASVLALVTDVTAETMRGVAEDLITVSDYEEAFLPSLAIIPLQLFAYYIALQRGCDIDKPRNLAKSVTVE